MNIYKKNTKTKTVIILAIVAVLCIGGYFGYSYFFPSQEQQSTQEKANASDQTNPVTKQDVGSPVDGKSQSAAGSTKTTDQIPVSNSMAIAIDSLSQQNGLVTFSGTLSNPDPNGTCSAVFTSKIDKPVTQTFAPKDGKCGPSSLSENAFTSIGTWTLTLRYFTNDHQVSAQKNIEIK